MVFFLFIIAWWSPEEWGLDITSLPHVTSHEWHCGQRRRWLEEPFLWDSVDIRECHLNSDEDVVAYEIFAVNETKPFYESWGRKQDEYFACAVRPEGSEEWIHVPPQKDMCAGVLVDIDAFEGLRGVFFYVRSPQGCTYRYFPSLLNKLRPNLTKEEICGQHIP